MITLVISLPNSDVRRRRIAGALQATGLSYRIIDGVIGKDLSQSELQEFAPRRFMARFGRDLGPGEIGCTLSHKLALETFLSSEDGTALVLEDDAVGRCRSFFVDIRRFRVDFGELAMSRCQLPVAKKLAQLLAAQE